MIGLPVLFSELNRLLGPEEIVPFDLYGATNLKNEVPVFSFFVLKILTRAPG